MEGKKVKQGGDFFAFLNDDRRIIAHVHFFLFLYGKLFAAGQTWTFAPLKTARPAKHPKSHSQLVPQSPLQAPAKYPGSRPEPLNRQGALFRIRALAPSPSWPSFTLVQLALESLI